MPSDFGHRFISDTAQAASMGAGLQADALMGMINRTDNAIQAENQSRVAQERERRRMEHEKELMRMQMEQQQRQAQILERLQAQRQQQPMGDPSVRSIGFMTDNRGNVIDQWRT